MRSSLVRLANRLLRPFGLRVVRTGIAVGIGYRRTAASRAVFDACDHEIVHGPFTGTKLSTRFAWGDANVGSVVLGCYEEQLHTPIEELIEVAPDLVVNIGSAEGTYSVGLARRLPASTIVAVDVDEDAGAAVVENARLNGVERQIDFQLGFSVGALEERLAQSRQPAVVIDCEGCEREYLDPEAVPSLARAFVLVELHEDIVPGITELLRRRLETSHHIVEIVESGRNPHAYEVLRSMSSIDKWLVVGEGRESTMSWFWCRPRSAQER